MTMQSLNTDRRLEIASNFDCGRVRPSLSVDAWAGVELYRGDRWSAHVQADAENINDRLNVVDFGGLFSSNAIGPPRSYSLRLDSRF